MLISGRDIDLVISRKTVHKRIDFASYTLINELIDEGCGEVILGTGLVTITIINTDSNSTMFFSHRDILETQSVSGMG